MKLPVMILFAVLSITALRDASTPQSQVVPDIKSFAAADTVSQACSDAVFRQFDYWIGEWTVRNTDGLIIGRSTVSRASDGCAILEEWSGARGNSGKSINFYDPEKDVWRQTWVGGSGLILDLEGNPEDGNITLYGKQGTPKGTLNHRIRWTLMDDGRVEQRWDTSTDDGETWKQSFVGYYESKE